MCPYLLRVVAVGALPMAFLCRLSKVSYYFVVYETFECVDALCSGLFLVCDLLVCPFDGSSVLSSAYYCASWGPFAS